MKLKFLIINIFIITFFVFFYIKFISKSCKKEDNAICKVKINNNILELRVAYTEEKQAQGLMFKESLKENEGMIFIYDKSRFLSFWMKNTLIPLSIAFIDDDYKIIGIYNMNTVAKDTPENQIPVYSSPGKAKYAIEAKKNWFSLRNINVGTYVDLPLELK
jgi:uncharacterized protein